MLGVFDPFSPDWLIVIAVAALMFGAKRLPEIARALGRSSTEFRKGLREGAVPDPEEGPPPDESAG